MIARQRHHFEEHIVVVRRRSYQFQFLVAHRFQWKIERGLHDGPKFSPGFSQGTGATRTRTRTTFFFFFSKNKKRVGQIFGVTPTPLVASCIALVRRHVIIPG